MKWHRLRVVLLPASSLLAVVLAPVCEAMMAQGQAHTFHAGASSSTPQGGAILDAGGPESMLRTPHVPLRSLKPEETETNWYRDRKQVEALPVMRNARGTITLAWNGDDVGIHTTPFGSKHSVAWPENVNAGNTLARMARIHDLGAADMWHQHHSNLAQWKAATEQRQQLEHAARYLWHQSGSEYGQGSHPVLPNVMQAAAWMRHKEELHRQLHSHTAELYHGQAKSKEDLLRAGDYHHIQASFHKGVLDVISTGGLPRYKDEQRRRERLAAEHSESGSSNLLDSHGSFSPWGSSSSSPSSPHHSVSSPSSDDGSKGKRPMVEPTRPRGGGRGRGRGRAGKRANPEEADVATATSALREPIVPTPNPPSTGAASVAPIPQVAAAAPASRKRAAPRRGAKSTVPLAGASSAATVELQASTAAVPPPASDVAPAKSRAPRSRDAAAPTTRGGRGGGAKKGAARARGAPTEAPESSFSFAPWTDGGAPPAP